MYENKIFKRDARDGELKIINRNTYRTAENKQEINPDKNKSR